MQPMPLAANTPDTFYRGAGRIGRFRGRPELAGDAHPEDWIASTTGRFGAGESGMSTLPDGRLLADAIAEAPEQWLGADHVARYGADPAVLVKLLDAGQRLPVHVHPDRRFAGSHLASPYGKTEAWVILEAAPDAVVYLGFRRDVDAAELAGWVDRKDTGAMLDAVNRVPVRAGDAVLVPAGLPHAIGDGVLLVEVQEPTDFSVLLEQEGFPVDPADALLGLPRDQALACVDRSGWGPDRVAALRDAGRPRGTRPGVRRLFPEAADEFFAAELLRPDPVSVLDPGFSVLVVTAGRGVLEPEAGPAAPLPMADLPMADLPMADLPVAEGDTLVVPYAAGGLTLRGDVAAIRARPA